MRWIWLTIFLSLISCVPGEKTPSERGGDSAPFIPPPPPEDEEFIPNLPPTRNTGLGTPVNLPQGAPTPAPFTPDTYALTLSGNFQIETIPFDSEGRLEYDNAQLEPLRSAKIEIYNAETDELLDTSYVRNGFYSFSGIPANIVFLRLYAESEQPIISVKDNTNNKQVYQYETEIFELANGAISNFTINVGWNGSLFYANSGQPDNIGNTIEEGHPDFLGGYLKDSFSAPFAILNQYTKITDTLKSEIAAVQIAKTGSSLGGANTKFLNTPLDVYWSPKNVSTAGLLRDGKINKAHYNPINNSIYLNGKIDLNTDEWDVHLQTELYAYSFLNNHSRSDLYSLNFNEAAIMQPSQLFPHSFATILTAIINGKDIYTEAGGVRGQTINRKIDLEKSILINKEWYQAEGQRKLLWDMFDDVNEGIDYDSLALDKLIGVLIDPIFIQDSHPNNFYKFARVLQDNNLDKKVYLRRILAYYSYTPDYEIFGPEVNDSSLPNEYDEFNPMFEKFEDLLETTIVNTDIKAAQTLTVAKNNGNCELAGSEDYLKFYAIADTTRIQINRDDLITVEILKNGEIIWESSNDENETFSLSTFNNLNNFLNGNGDLEHNHYFIRARSHPGMTSATGTVQVRLYDANFGGAPSENITNQFQLYTIGFDPSRRVDVLSYNNNCHPHPTIERRRFKTAANKNVRINLEFDNKDLIEYKIIIDDEVMAEGDNSANENRSHIFTFDDPPNTDKYLEIQFTNPDNLFTDHGVVYELEYLAQ